MKVQATTLLVSSLLVINVAPTFAAPVTANRRTERGVPRSHPITRRSPSRIDPDRLIAWSQSNRNKVQRKYGLQGQSAKVKRQGTEALTNLEWDSTWLTDIEVGTPAKTYAVVLDTGSSDFWLGTQSFDPASSSTFTNSSTSFDLTYGSGDVAGYLGTDTVTLAGTTGTDVVLAVADDISSDLVDPNIDGIMGMGFKVLSSANADPFWEQMGFDTFAFYLERRTSESPKGDTAPGGTFTLGGTNTSFYQGDINYVPVIQEQYWMLALGGLSVSGMDLALGSTTRAAIDTGTTLIGGPDDVIESLYAHVGGSAAIPNSPGYYSYPCDAKINATVTFGGVTYTMPDADFSAGALDSSGKSCMGAFFGTGATSKDNLQWIVGDAFLKNVYSIFTTADATPRVGFAQLVEGLNDAVETNTVVVTSAPTTPSSLTNGAVGSLRTSTFSSLPVAAAAAVVMLISL